MASMLLIAGLLFAAATALFVAATSIVLRTRMVLQKGVATYGTVVDRERRGTASSTLERVIEYNLLSGKPMAIRPSRTAWRWPLSPGDRVPVIFVPDRPQLRRILVSAELWSLPLILAAGGMLLGGCGLLVLVLLS